MAYHNEFHGSGHPEEEKKVSPVAMEKPPVMDHVAQVLWERFLKTSSATHHELGLHGENASRGLQVRDLYCAILLLYNDINKTLRPGPHHDPPRKEEVELCLKSSGETSEEATLDRVEFSAFLETFTKNAIRRNELLSYFKAVRSGAHHKHEPDTGSHEPGPSRHLKADDSEDHLTRKLKELKHSDAENAHGSLNVLRHGRTDSAVNLNSFSGGSHFQIFNFAGADLDTLATFVKHIRK